MNPIVSLRKALADPELLGRAMPGPSWQPWHVLTIAAVGERLLPDERLLFKEFTDREKEPEPGRLVSEAWFVKGRRAGGTRAAATIATYFACLCDHSDTLASGERASLPILATNTAQATRAFNYVLGILQDSPRLAAEIESATADTIRLRTRVDIEIKPANFRTIRGSTSICAILDELAFWAIEGSANPDVEVIDALRPSLITTQGPLWVISSPYAKRGELYAAYKRDYGPNGDPVILVAKGSSKQFNSTLPDDFIARAYERDGAVASAEYGGEFRSDLEVFVSREALEACVSTGIIVRAPLAGVSYVGFCDPSGGSSDAMTMAIGHLEGNMAILDCVGERKAPFSPDSVVGEFSEVFKNYHVTKIRGDRYAGEWPRERFAVHGIAYEASDLNRSELYLGFLPLVNSGRADLLDDKRMIAQFVGLERRTSRVGKDSVDHAPGAHDDLSNSVAGCLVAVDSDRRPTLVSLHSLLGHDGQALPMPTMCRNIFGLVAEGPGGTIAVIYGCTPRGLGPPLLILDIWTDIYHAQLVRDASVRVVELFNQCHADLPFLYLPKNLAPYASGSLVEVVPIPDHFVVQDALLPCAAFVGQVKITEEGLEKSRTSDFGAAFNLRAADEIVTAAQVAYVSMLAAKFDIGWDK